MDIFETSDSFFEWYLSKIKEFVPSLEGYVLSNRQKSIVKRIPKLSKDEQKILFKTIRKISPIPSNVFLVYDHSSQTWASRYNTRLSRLEIIVPVYGFYMLRYPPVVRAAVQHEMGHILNRDFLVQIEGHGSCTNIAMDCRINAHINREDLKDLYDATYWFRVKRGKMIVPEEYYRDIGLPLIKGAAAYSWKTIHDYYHFNDTKKKQDKKKKPETYVKEPQVGDIVQVRKGDKEGLFGKVVDIVDGKSVVEQMTAEQVQEHFDKLEDEINYK